MNLFTLSWKNIWHKPFNALLSLSLLALGVGLIALLLLLNRQIQAQFERNLAGIDLVIGAKGSPLQLILSSMYHIDAPTGNISIEEARPFLNPRHPLIETAIPLSLGDSHRGYRIVGTTPGFLELYALQVAEGRLWEKPMEVVAGRAVAEALGLKVGSRFRSSHGFVEDENLVHEDAQAFEVVGILEPSGSVADQLLLCDAQSVWLVHDHEEEATAAEEEHAHGPDEQHHGHEAEPNARPDQPSGRMALLAHPEQDITALLIRFKGRSYQALNMQRAINENTNMQAATPAIEINRLYNILGGWLDALQILAYVIIGVSALSVFVSLYSSLRERRYELAIMRVGGATPRTLFLLIVMEGLLLAVLGWLLGIALSHLAMEVIAGRMEADYRYSFSGLVFLPQEWWLLGAALGIGLLAAVIPAIRASQTDISETLAEG
jgi:putative ABC transport system permease protein